VGQQLASCGEKQKKKENYDRQDDIWRSEIASLMILTQVFQALETSIGMTPSGESGREGRLNKRIPA
jgi:hypothetical protein